MATRRTTDPSREKPSRIASTETRARGNLGPSPTSEVEARERAEPRRDARAASILHAALGYAARGWCVFPVYEISEAGICSCRKARDCDRPGKHPRVKGWQAKATTDVATLRWWWSQWSHANVGIATGARSGFVVLDVDPRHGGDASLAAFEAEDGELPATFTIATGGGSGSGGEQIGPKRRHSCSSSLRSTVGRRLTCLRGRRLRASAPGGCG